MRRADFWKLSLLNVTATPVRSLLTVLGMAIGVGAILAVLTLGDAGKTQVESEMMRLGIDKVWLSPSVQPLRHGDGALLSEALETTVTEQAYGRLTARTAGGEAECVAVGCSQDYLHLMDARLCAGRELHPLEWEAGSRSVLLGRKLAQTLGCEKGGGRVALGGLLLEVRGVISLQNQLSQIDGDSALFLPISVFCELMGGAVQELTLSVRRGDTPRQTADEAIRALETRAGRTAQAMTMQVQIEAANSVIVLFVDVLKWVAFICILVGGIGVMNILLVSVRERRREIGVMKSLGASEAQICALFLLEAFQYAAVGGVLGVLTGFGLIRLAASAIGLSPIVKPADVLTVAAAATVIGLLFGVAPASSAARMAPVDALRE